MVKVVCLDDHQKKSDALHALIAAPHTLQTVGDDELRVAVELER